MMLRILICSESDLRPLLASTVIGRQKIELYRADGLRAVRLLSATLDPRAILVDRDLPAVRGFVEAIREDPATRQRSLAVLARGAVKDVERELLEAGANVVLRLPPDPGWDERLSRLLTVPARYEARLPVRLDVDTQPESAGAVVNISGGGMLLATRQALRLNDEVSFRVKLPDGTTVAGRGRVARVAEKVGYGMEFVSLPDAGRAAIDQFLRSARMA
jgi:CheY-like chemotaxis protein